MGKRIFIGIMVAVIILAMFVGCGRVEETKTVYAECNYEGGIDIFVEGEGFRHWYSDVVDFVEGDPSAIAKSNGLDPIYGIFVLLGEGSDEPTNMAIFKDGKVARIDTQYKLLPRANYGQPYVFCETKEASMTLTLKDSNNYALLINRANQLPIKVDGVDDAWAAYDTIYWLKDNNVYSLDWEQSGAQPQLFFEGANAVSHGSDESEGALVLLDKANYDAYGRSDIYSPYGIINN